jgi:hypothetical protein
VRDAEPLGNSASSRRLLRLGGLVCGFPGADRLEKQVVHLELLRLALLRRGHKDRSARLRRIAVLISRSRRRRSATASGMERLSDAVEARTPVLPYRRSSAIARTSPPSDA